MTEQQTATTPVPSTAQPAEPTLQPAEQTAQPTEQTAQPAEQTAQPAGQPASGRRPLKRATKIRLAVIGGIALIIAVVFLVNFLVDSRTWVTTDNAQIDGNQIVITAPATGTLTGWHGQLGRQISNYEPVGRIALQAGYAQPQVVIRAPAAGTIAADNGVEGAFVNAGTQLAIAYDGSGVFVTARVDETQIDAVHPGADVRVLVDAFPGQPLEGRVAEVKTGAAGVFSMFPQSNTSGNFQKVTQVIPVKITIDDLRGLPLVPGMNVTVKIRRG